MSVAGFAGRDGALPTANTHDRGRGPLQSIADLRGMAARGAKRTFVRPEQRRAPADSLTTYIEAGRNELDRRPDSISNRALLNPLSNPERM